MAYFDWNDSYHTGNQDIDSQHMTLIGLVNKLHAAMGSGQGNAQLRDIFGELVSYVDYHFKAEEKMFAQVHYPEAQTHILAHQSLVKKALELKAKFDSGSEYMSIKVLNFLTEWVNGHILHMDMGYKGII